MWYFSTVKKRVKMLLFTLLAVLIVEPGAWHRGEHRP
jgi:hypothetical protein